MKYLRNLSPSVFLCAALSGCASTTASTAKAPETAYPDAQQFSAETSKDIYSYAVKIEVLSTIKKDDSSELEEMEIKSFAGTGMLLTEKYVLTVAHILPPQMTRHENLVVANTVIAGDHQAKVIKVDHEKELALLQAEDCPEDRCFDHYFAGKIAAATDIGEVTATVGYPHEEKILFKGLVSGKMVYDHHTYTLIDNGINNGFTTLGSSGSPVFVFQDEKPLLGALVIGVYVDGQLKNVRAVLATPIEELREFLAGVKGLEQRLD